MGENQETAAVIPPDQLGRRYLWMVKEEEFRLVSMPDAKEYLAAGVATVRGPDGKMASPLPPGRCARHPDEPVPFELVT